MNGDSEGTLGLIAGGGLLPKLITAEMNRQGRTCFVAGFANTADDVLSSATDSDTFQVSQLGQILNYFKQREVDVVSLAGQIDHSEVLHSEDFDKHMLELISHSDNRAEALLKRLVVLIEREVAPVASLIDILQDHVIKDEQLTREPTDAESRDLEFGWKLAFELARFNIGQTIAIKNGIVIAVEALEGTDGMIRRTAQFDLDNTCIIKVPMENKDPRFDVPTIGPDTIRSMKSAGATALQVAAFETILIDREQTLKLAEEADISITARGLGA